MSDERNRVPKGATRREALKGIASIAALLTTSCARTSGPAWDLMLKKHFRDMSRDEIDAMLARLQKQYSRELKRDVTLKATPARKDVLFGYALDISRCVGCRRCVHACVKENNQSRDPEVQWITVLKMDKEHGVDLEHATPNYNPETVPEPGSFYFPVACQHCENPPCVKVCPVKATWKDTDGIVVIDYDRCIGCRCCMTACPYGARHFNWTEPKLEPADVNPNMEYLGNRPRKRGVVEKCTFCVQRTREGRYPACVEVCPVGARKFGNLLDPESEIRYILEHKRVLVLKQELNTQPKFFYYYG